MLKRAIGICGAGVLSLLLLAGCLGQETTGPGAKSMRKSAQDDGGTPPLDSLICLLPEGCASPKDSVDFGVPNPKEDRSCIAVYDPVCGADGITYGNECEAGNTPIAFKGPCGDPSAGPDPIEEPGDSTVCDLPDDPPVDIDPVDPVDPGPPVFIPGPSQPDPDQACIQVITKYCGTDGITYTFNDGCGKPPVPIAYAGGCGSPLSLP